jgi:uncharacterized flavoprotein (TIGR03862 family)
MAADILSQAGVSVDLFDAMPSVGRKFLLAGRGGLNLTHSEALAPFLGRYGEREAALSPMVTALDPTALREWAKALGIDTFIGSSGRVFPTDMKAAPLLRAWLHRLRAQGVRFHMRHRWVGVVEPVAGAPEGGSVGTSDQQRTWRFNTPQGEQTWTGRAMILALGGASWSRLGSDGAWVPGLSQVGVDVAPLKPSNCGFDVAPTAPGREAWSDFLRDRHAGEPLKPVALSLTDVHGQQHRQAGEFVLTYTGVEGSLIYAFSKPIRELIERDGHATIELDLLPQHSPEQVLAEVTRARGPRSLATHLKSRLGITGLKAALMHEVLSSDQIADGPTLARLLKALPVTLQAPRPIDEAISTAGGVKFEALDEQLMSKALPGVFCAGEMLDWEAPTGGYLLTATMASGRWAALGLLDWLKTSKS